MKLLLENWRKYLREMVEPFARGGDYSDFLAKHTDEALAAYRRMGADERILSVISKYADEGVSSQEPNQVTAVLAGQKPMWYGSSNFLPTWSEIDQDCYDSLPPDPEPVPVLQEQDRNCPNVEVGKFILENMEKIGLAYEEFPGRLAILGKPENVSKVAKEFNRIGSLDNADDRFHRVMGTALGYPQEDVESFISHGEDRGYFE